jgi:hypothetical protein
VTRSALLTIALLAVAASRGDLSAQTPSVAGVVRDSVGRPIPFAEVSIGALRTRTDSVGHFYLSFTQRDSVTVEVRRMGYQLITFSLSTAELVGKDLDVVLNFVPFALPEVAVENASFRHLTPLAGFDERRARGAGIFLTQGDIARRNTDRLSHILRSEPGVIITRGRDGRESLRFARAKPGCMPQYWVDNQPVRDFGINDISARDVEAIELYASFASTPGQFVRGPTLNCGTVVIWSKRPILERP